MTVPKWISPLFVIAALYDAVLGVMFLVIPWGPFQWFEVPPPNHLGYVQFPAALLIVFASLFFAIARDPAGNRSLIPYGIGLKISFCTIASWHWLATGIPGMWKPFVIIDAAMLVLFVAAWMQLGAAREAHRTA